MRSFRDRFNLDLRENNSPKIFLPAESTASIQWNNFNLPLNLQPASESSSNVASQLLTSVGMAK